MEALQPFKSGTITELPSPFFTYEGGKKYEFSIINGEPYGFFKIVAVAFEYIKDADQIGSRLLGKSKSEEYWKHDKIVEKLSVEKGSDANNVETVELAVGSRQKVANEFRFIRDNAKGLKDMGDRLVIVVPYSKAYLM